MEFQQACHTPTRRAGSTVVTGAARAKNLQESREEGVSGCAVTPDRTAQTLKQSSLCGAGLGRPGHPSRSTDTWLSRRSESGAAQATRGSSSGKLTLGRATCPGRASRTALGAARPCAHGVPSERSTYLHGRRVVFEDLQDSHDAERQVPRGGEQQRGREAADGDQHLHLREKTGARLGRASGPGSHSRHRHGRTLASALRPRLLLGSELGLP